MPALLENEQEDREKGRHGTTEYRDIKALAHAPEAATFFESAGNHASYGSGEDPQPIGIDNEVSKQGAGVIESCAAHDRGASDEPKI